jgi:hypothetical protein
MELQILKAATWAQEQAKKYPFAEIIVRVIVHDGEIRRIERTLTEKLQEVTVND